MGKNSKIKYAPGCANCYADTQAKRNPKVLGIWGPNGTRVVASEDMWGQPEKWNRAAERDGVRRRVFCASLADVFDDWSGRLVNHHGDLLYDDRHGGWTDAYSDANGHREFLRLGAVRARLFALIDATPHLDWLLLTKRPENIRKMWPAAGTGKDPGSSDYLRRDNVWIGTSVACQEDAERNIPLLLQCRDLAPVLWLSVEPLVERVMLHPWIEDDTFHHAQGVDTDWVVVGGESGPNARPCNVEWIRSVVEQCQDTGVPVFVKQLGSQPTEPDGAGFVRHVMLRDKKGGDPSEWPEDLRVREFPGVASR